VAEFKNSCTRLASAAKVAFLSALDSSTVGFGSNWFTLSRSPAWSSDDSVKLIHQTPLKRLFGHHSSLSSSVYKVKKQNTASEVSVMSQSQVFNAAN